MAPVGVQVDSTPSTTVPLSLQSEWVVVIFPSSGRPAPTSLPGKKNPVRDPPALGSSAAVSWVVGRMGTDAHLYNDPDDASIPALLDSRFDADKVDTLKRLLALIPQGVDVANLFPQELLALGERIGTVNTGLSDDALAKCLARSIYMPTASGSHEDCDRKCSVCQEKYLAGGEVGKMACKHYYHMSCIQHWLMQKNWCPICKSAALNTN